MVDNNNSYKVPLSEKVVTDIRDTFEILDGDKDGFISIKDLGETMTKLDSTVRSSDAQELVNEFESDNMDFKTFEAFWHMKLNEALLENDHFKLFDFFDRDRNGLVEAGDLIVGFNALGAKMTEEEADEMILEADLDGDRLLDKEEFARMLQAIS
mmetsp:Transcript_26354/g.27414  ORF Transcript_26354/g.27414 Transcript_26354/m.27414 type:complete len:155 (-) Transcript_26354:44-508(-)